MAKQSDILPSLFWDSVPLTSNDCGVYGIINRANGRIYIGGSENLSRRRCVHKYGIRHGRHHVQELQKDILETPDSFEFVIIEQLTDPSLVIQREQFWMDFFQSYNSPNGYNKCRIAGSMIGYKHGPEMRAKFGLKLRGRKRPPRSKEWRQKLSTGLAGRRCPEKHKPVVRTDSAGCEIKFDSLTDAGDDLGKGTSLICKVLKSGSGTAYGFSWRYANPSP